MKLKASTLLPVFGFLCVSILSYSQPAEKNVKEPLTHTNQKTGSKNNELKSFSIGLGITSTLQLGAGYEYVFDKSGSVKSLLEWQTLPAQSLGIQAELYAAGGLHTLFSADFFIPLKSGKMTDKDFTLSAHMPLLTQYSEHQNRLKNGMHYNVTVGWIRPLIEYTVNKTDRIKISAEPLIGITYLYHQWEASEGYTQYAHNANPPQTEVTDKTPKEAWSGKAARYTQKILLPNIGLLFQFELPQKWELKTAVQVCPQILAVTEDIHYGRSIVFYDAFAKNGFSFHLHFYAERNIAGLFNFFAAVDYTSVVSYSGQTAVYNLQTEKLENMSGYGAAGTSFHMGGIRIGLILRYTQ